MLKIISRAAFACLAAAPLLSCVTPSAPSYSSSGAPSNAPISFRGPVSIQLSDNTRSFLQYMGTSENVLSSQILPNRQAQGDLDAAGLVEAVRSKVKSALPGSSASGGGSGKILIDVKAQLGKSSGETTSVDVGAIAVDAQGRQFSEVRGQGSGTIPYPAWDYRFAEASQEALSEFSRNFRRAVGGGGGSAAGGKPAADEELGVSPLTGNCTADKRQLEREMARMLAQAERSDIGMCLPARYNAAVNAKAAQLLRRCPALDESGGRDIPEFERVARESRQIASMSCM